MLIFLDNGHGGCIAGEYQTAGKRSPKFEDGRQLFEGEFNRSIVNRIIEQLQALNISYINVAPEYTDTSLKIRVKRANDFYTKMVYNYSNAYQESIYISIHANAYGKDWNSANGFSCYTSRGETASDIYAEEFYKEASKEFPNAKMRKDNTDGDSDKEANFYVLRKTLMPAVLTENFFMTNPEEARLLLSETGRERIARYHINAIKKIMNLNKN